MSTADTVSTDVLIIGGGPSGLQRPYILPTC